MINIRKWFKKSAAIAISTVIAGSGLLFFSQNAFAGTALSVGPNFPDNVIVGQTAVPVSLTVGNGSTADEGTITVSNVTLIPSCGNFTVNCTSPDPGVFAVSANGTGKVGTSCAGDTFTIAQID